MKRRILPLILFSFGIAAGQVGQGVVGVPWLGWVFDAETHAVRPITGIPMSALLGDRIDLEMSSAVGSPEGTFALGVAADGGRVLVVQGSGAVELAGATANPSRMVMSPRGRVAALYYEDGNRVQLFEGLPLNGHLVHELTVGGTPGTLAVDDAASTVLASTEGGLFSYKVEQGRQLLVPSNGILEAGFFGGSSDFVAAEIDKVTVLRNGQKTELAEQEGIIAPANASASGDGRSVIVLLKSGNVVIRNLQTGISATLQCECTPNELTRMRGNSVFRLNSPKDGTIWLLNGDDDEPKMTFIATQGEKQ